MTTTAEVKDCINVNCQKLKARYEHLYASFHVELHISSSDMKHALELFMSNDSWPDGVLVRRYFYPKQQNS